MCLTQTPLFTVTPPYPEKTVKLSSHKAKAPLAGTVRRSARNQPPVAGPVNAAPAHHPARRTSPVHVRPDSSSDSEIVNSYKSKMPSTAKNVAHVEQDSSSKPPTLHSGDISPSVMREFEECCRGYFENKEIDDDKQVRKILAGLKDTRVRDWISSDRARILALSFDNFMTEFRAAYLDQHWEENTRRELGSMTQGNDSFWDYSIRVQSHNALLAGTCYDTRASSSSGACINTQR
jgi:hypothetical protein